MLADEGERPLLRPKRGPFLDPDLGPFGMAAECREHGNVGVDAKRIIAPVPGGDHAAQTFAWNILVKCGPKGGDAGASWHAETSDDGWFASPDNCAVDAEGRLWVATDQGEGWPKTKRADGL